MIDSFGIHLTVLLVVESLQLQHLAILPVATFIILGDVVELGVEREHVEVHRLSLHRLDGCQHVTDKLTRRCAGWVNTDADDWLFQGVALLCLG